MLVTNASDKPAMRTLMSPAAVIANLETLPRRKRFRRVGVSGGILLADPHDAATVMMMHPRREKDRAIVGRRREKGCFVELTLPFVTLVD